MIADIQDYTEYVPGLVNEFGDLESALNTLLIMMKLWFHLHGKMNLVMNGFFSE